MTNASDHSLPKLSIVSITFNHEAYIKETLDSFVAQRTEFPFEIIVADDASTDDTAAIVRKYARSYPNLFRPILRTRNVGVHANFTDALSSARGDYIALCEGDDFWTDPYKLSKQVTFLEQNPRTTVCFHPVRVTSDGQTVGSEYPPISWRADLSIEALIARNFIQTNSVVYRRIARYDDIPADVMPLDWYLHVRHAVRGEIAMLPDTMAVYRRHAEGIWHSAYNDPTEFWLKRGPGVAAMLEAMLDLFPDDTSRQRIVGQNAEWVLRELEKVPSPEGRDALLDCIRQHPRLAMLALQHHRFQTPIRRIRHRISSETLGWKAYLANLATRMNLSRSRVNKDL